MYLLQLQGTTTFDSTRADLLSLSKGISLAYKAPTSLSRPQSYRLSLVIYDKAISSTTIIDVAISNYYFETQQTTTLAMSITMPIVKRLVPIQPTKSISKYAIRASISLLQYRVYSYIPYKQQSIYNTTLQYLYIGATLQVSSLTTIKAISSLVPRAIYKSTLISV